MWCIGTGVRIHAKFYRPFVALCLKSKLNPKRSADLVVPTTVIGDPISHFSTFPHICPMTPHATTTVLEENTGPWTLASYGGSMSLDPHHPAGGRWFVAVCIPPPSAPSLHCLGLSQRGAHTPHRHCIGLSPRGTPCPRRSHQPPLDQRRRPCTCGASHALGQQWASH